MKLYRLRALVLAAASLIANQLVAQEDEAANEVAQVFRYGGACNQLTQLTTIEISGITHGSYSEQFSMFCKPEGTYRCEEYTAFLLGRGTLEENGRNSCRFLPAAT